MSLFIEFESQMTIVKSLIKEMKEAMPREIKINSHLILGDRGVGKTTIIKLFEEAVRADSKLNDAYNLMFVPASFHGIESFQVIERLISNVDVNRIKKHQILVIDDLDLILTHSEGNAHALRELLIRDEPRIALVATAHSSFADNLGPDKALYGFLSQHTLEGATDNDVSTLLKGVLRTPVWHKINEELVLTNTFWVMTIADNNPRLLTILRNVFHSFNVRMNDSKAKINPSHFLTLFFEMAGPSFRSELMELPRSGRYFLEEASSYPHYFKIRDISLNVANPSREASKLVQIGYLKKNEDGEYSFSSRPLKSWLRYMKQIPLGKVLNVDLPVYARFAAR